MSGQVRAKQSQNRNLLANETLYQLSYDPIQFNCKHLRRYLEGSNFLVSPVCVPLLVGMSKRRGQTREFLEKIPNFPSLYRHSVNGTYYGIKKVSGKKKSHSLDTTDRKIAERRLKDWLQDLDKIDAEAAKTTLASLLGTFTASNAGKAKKTQDTNNSILNVLKATWKPGLDHPRCRHEAIPFERMAGPA